MASGFYPSFDLPWLEISIFVLSVYFVFVVFDYSVLRSHGEQAVHFKVPLPEQCDPRWKGLELENPSIKVEQTMVQDSTCSKWIDYVIRPIIRAPFNAIVLPQAGHWALSTQPRQMESIAQSLEPGKPSCRGHRQHSENEEKS